MSTAKVMPSGAPHAADGAQPRVGDLLAEVDVQRRQLAAAGGEPREAHVGDLVAALRGARAVSVGLAAQGRGGAREALRAARKAAQRAAWRVA